jgi:hypothetical protein
MDVYASSSGLQRVVGYGPQSVVLTHHDHNHHDHNHNHHNHNHHHHIHSIPPRSLPKPTSSYQLVPFVPAAPTAIYVPIPQERQQKQQQQRYQYQQPPGKHLRNIYRFIFFLFQLFKIHFLPKNIDQVSYFNIAFFHIE